MNTAEQHSPPPPTPENAALSFAAETRSDEAIKLILLTQLQAMARNEGGMLDRSNEEFLHAYRIAIRRSRTALTQFKAAFPESQSRRYLTHLVRLAKVTAPARDNDVHLLQFETLKSQLPAAYREAIEPLRELLKGQAEWSYGAIVRELTSSQHLRFLVAWQHYLEAPCPRQPRESQSLLPIMELAHQRIWKLYRRTIKQGSSIKSASPPEQIHELRKTCKKLRYLLEFFRPLHPPDSLGQAIKILKKLQDYLGSFQDVHVQIQTVTQSFPALRKQSATPPESLLAMGILLGRLETRQQELRDEFPKRFKAFVDHRNQTVYRKLFQPAPESAAVMDKPV